MEIAGAIVPVHAIQIAEIVAINAAQLVLTVQKEHKEMLGRVVIPVQWEELAQQVK